MEQGIFACKYILSVGRQSGQHAKDEMKLQQFTRSRSIINQSLYSLPVQLAVVHSHARATSTYVDPYDYGPGGVERPFFLRLRCRSLASNARDYPRSETVILIRSSFKIYSIFNRGLIDPRSGKSWGRLVRTVFRFTTNASGTAEQTKAALRAASLRWHPDKCVWSIVSSLATLVLTA